MGIFPWGYYLFFIPIMKKSPPAIRDNMTIYYAAFGLLIVCILYFSIRKPIWMKPTWVTWVEKYPQKVITKMAEAIKDNPDWEKNTVDEASVDAWAKKISRK